MRGRLRQVRVDRLCSRSSPTLSLRSMAKTTNSSRVGRTRLSPASARISRTTSARTEQQREDPLPADEVHQAPVEVDTPGPARRPDPAATRGASARAGPGTARPCINRSTFADRGTTPSRSAARPRPTDSTRSAGRPNRPPGSPAVRETLDGPQVALATVGQVAGQLARTSLG